MYVDKLDGKVSATFFERKAAEWRAEQGRLAACIEDHQSAGTTYLEEGGDLLELVSTAHKLFEIQPAHEKRRLLRFVLSNCTWKGGELQSTFRQPFDFIADTVAEMKKPPMSAGLENGQTKKWLLR